MAFYAHDFVDDSPINNFCLGNPLANKWGSAKIEHRYGWTDGHGGSKATNISSIEIPPTGAWYFEILHPNTQAPVFVLQQGTMAFGTYGNNTDGMEIVSTSGIPLGGAYEWQSPLRRAHSGDYSRLPVGQGIVGFYVDMENSMFALKCGSNLYEYSFNHNGWIDFKNTEPIHMGMGNGGGAATLYFNFGTNPTFNGNLTSTHPDVNGDGLFFYNPLLLDGSNTSYASPIPAKALCTKNLPEGPIKLSKDQTPSDNFKAVTWSGTTYANATVPVGFTPDFVWAKAKNVNSNHRLVDSVRGGNGSLMYELASNDTRGNGTDSAITGLSNNGINLSSGNFGAVSGQDVVAWCWKAAGSPDQDYASANDGSAKIINEDGSANTSIQDCAALATAATNAGASNVITPSKVSANRQNGFSIVKYRGNSTGGATVPHGLDKAPDFILYKRLTTTSQDWGVYHISGSQKLLQLNTANSYWNSGQNYWEAIPSNTVFYPDNTHSDHYQNIDNEDYIAYCWHSVENYSKCGSYIGNGSSDGPYIECGFRVGWLMIKNTSALNNWVILDNQRSPNNLSSKGIRAESSGVELDEPTNYGTDILSNGFKPKTSGGATTNNNNAPSNVYIFMAFSEQPFSGPSNAR